MKKASMTPFCTLCLMLIASVLFALLESVRVHGLDYYASLKTEAGLDSLCAEYQPLLWEQYGMLALDGAYGTEYFSEEYVTERLEELISMQSTKEGSVFFPKGMDLFGLSLKEAELEGYALLTDEHGELFLKYVAERMKEKLPIGIAEDIYTRYQSHNLGQDNGSTIREAEETLEWAKTKKWNEIEEKLREAKTEDEEELARADLWMLNSSRVKTLENLLGSVSDLKSKSVLSMILGDVSQLSNKISKPETYILDRKRKEGNIHYTREADWYQRVLVLQYMDEFFSCYGEPKEGHYLDYEMEYVLSGKNSELKNLEAVLQKIILVREMANVTSLLKDAEKMRQAEEMAMGISLLIGENPAVVKVVQMGLIAAWAYSESILDVRALMDGEKISIIKNQEEWTLKMTDMLQVFQVGTKAKGCEKGFNYKDYLKLLLLTEREQTMAYRMLEVMEMSLHKNSDYKNCKMDQMILAVQYRLHFESRPVFFSLMTIGNPSDKSFQFVKEELRSYVP